MAGSLDPSAEKRFQSLNSDLHAYLNDVTDYNPDKRLCLGSISTKETVTYPFGHPSVAKDASCLAVSALQYQLKHRGDLDKQNIALEVVACLIDTHGPQSDSAELRDAIKKSHNECSLSQNYVDILTCKRLNAITEKLAQFNDGHPVSRDADKTMNRLEARPSK